jgi:Protein of unknown function (DUF2442)
MTSSASSPVLARPRATAAAIQGAQLRVTVEDGREIIVPVTWFEFLERATEAQRNEFLLIGDGTGIWWEQLNDGISVPQLFGLPPDP